MLGKTRWIPQSSIHHTALQTPNMSMPWAAITLTSEGLSLYNGLGRRKSLATVLNELRKLPEHSLNVGAGKPNLQEFSRHAQVWDDLFKCFGLNDSGQM